MGDRRGSQEVVAAERGRLAAMYLQHAHGAGRLAFLLTGSREEADDLVQEAFVRVARRFVHLRDPEAFEAYLRRTVVNLARSEFRRRRRERAFVRAQPPAAPDVGGLEPDRSDELAAALLRLSPRQRAAVVLRFYEDLSVDRTAEILRCRPGTVKALVSQALANLREVIEDA